MITLRAFTKCNLFFLSSTVQAESALTFKQESLDNAHCFLYIIVISSLFALLFFLAKKSTRLMNTSPKCQIIEKIRIHHKTSAYIIDYRGQHFLIADNQNALAIHPLHVIPSATKELH